MAHRVSQLPGIATVRGITRPTGQRLKEARATYQAGEVGARLGSAASLISENTDDLDLLANGANALADRLGDVRGEVGETIVSVRSLVDSLAYIENQFGGSQTLGEIDNAAKLVTGIRALGVNLLGAGASFKWLDPVVAALDASPICESTLSCRTTRAQFHQLVIARNDGRLDKVRELAWRLQSTDRSQTLSSTVTGLQNALDTAITSLQSLGLDDPSAAHARLATAEEGADTLAEASRRLAGGVQLLVDQTMQMGAGLDEASVFLQALRRNAATPSMAGFNIPPEVFNLDEFKTAAKYFISPDGHAVRYLIQTELNPFSTEAMDQVTSITDTARGAQPNTMLADASASVSGYSATLRDTRDYYNHDIRFIIVVTIIVVLLILIALLRAIVAPLYLIGSVLVSYLSALGIGVVMFQFILGQELHWSVPGLTFIILVAVGADYNMLLISRIRDEAPRGTRFGVIRTVGSTGGVITAAGLIFAASMFGLLFSSISTIVQAGFVVGVGILLDTFVVRTITVPAIAALLGPANWWPSHLGRGRRNRA